eukprot:CAMPEP_0116879018 /NCGR_PEP_ID=MMETSP0463-20121206/10771_1 /TAXON_ID=181622 /ORGANISM="Strombidinopsis sp, Strain SopsisLIS2011" /LENGTH=83 /DNA_ID=CAMNT_0004527825 /DNA_START=212 /DNA_END=463 /DNA_ORIENTATION=+
MSGLEGYAEWLSSIVNFDASEPFGWGFGANKTTYDYMGKFYNENQFLYAKATYCKVYDVSIDMFNMPEPSYAFLTALNDLANS